MSPLRASLLFCLALVACTSADDTDAVNTSSSQAASTATSASAGGASTGGGGTGGTSIGGGGMGGGQGGGAAFALTSTAFAQDAMIPMQYECSPSGQNISPPLAWTAGPSGTMSYAVVLRDLDFMNGFVHWAIWDIPASATGLPEDVEHVYQPADPAGAKQAPFNGGEIGYHGPCSPSSVNTYEFTVYAIDVATIPGLDAMSTKEEAATAIVGAATATATLSGES